jgi:hypothetical protein
VVFVRVKRQRRQVRFTSVMFFGIIGSFPRFMRALLAL